MDVGKIILNSFKYPLRNIAKLPILFILFILIAIVPIGMVMDNKYLMFIGLIGFFLFILIVPGYMLSIVKTGSIGSSAFPSFNLTNTVHDSIRVLCLRMVYMIVPAVMFFGVLTLLGPTSVDLLRNFQIHTFIATLGLMINKVIGDILNIGIFNIIKWLILMVILIGVISFVASFVLSIPYVGFLIYIGIIIPVIESISNYSVGLVYSNIARNNLNDLRRLQREMQF